MPERRRWIGALVAFAAVLLLVLVAKGAGFLTAEAPQVSSTPIVRSRTAAVPAIVGSTPTCIVGVDLGPDTARAVVQAFGPAAVRPGPALELTARAGDYVARGRQPAGYVDGALLGIAFAPAPTQRTGTLCLRAVGGRASLRGGAAGRDLAAQRTVIGRDDAPVQLAVTLTAAEPASLLSRAGQLLHRAAFLRPALVGSLSLGLLALLVALGVPLAVGVALVRAARADDQPR